MTTEEAETAALEVAREQYSVGSGDALVIDRERTEERPIGWLFSVQSRRFLETGDYDAEVVATRRIFVARLTGRAAFITGETPTNFEAVGSPDHDFPGAAWIAVPLGAAASLLTWGGSWLVLDVGLDWLRKIPILWGLVVGIAVGVLCAAPVVVAIRWASFANVHRAIPMTMASVGALGGELAFWAYHAGSISDALGLVLSQHPGYVAMHGAGIMAAIVMASAIGSRDKESRSLWRGD